MLINLKINGIISVTVREEFMSIKLIQHPVYHSNLTNIFNIYKKINIQEKPVY